MFCQRRHVDATHSPGDGWPAALRTSAAPCFPLWDPSRGLLVLFFLSFCFCCCSVAQLGPTLCDPMNCSTPGFPVLHYVLEFPQTQSIELVMPSNHLILSHPLLLLPSVFPSIRVFSSESTLRIRWPKYWSSRFSISPSNEYSGLI